METAADHQLLRAVPVRLYGKVLPRKRRSGIGRVIGLRAGRQSPAACYSYMSPDVLRCRSGSGEMDCRDAQARRLRLAPEWLAAGIAATGAAQSSEASESAT